MPTHTRARPARTPSPTHAHARAYTPYARPLARPRPPNTHALSQTDTNAHEHTHTQTTRDRAHTHARARSVCAAAACSTAGAAAGTAQPVRPADGQPVRRHVDGPGCAVSTGVSDNWSPPLAPFNRNRYSDAPCRSIPTIRTPLSMSRMRRERRILPARGTACIGRAVLTGYSTTVFAGGAHGGTAHTYALPRRKP
jgi:hypothetical protein